MFEGLNWKAAARRSAIVIGIYVGLFYVLSVAFPRSFPFDASLLPMAAFFFIVFTFVYAFIERNRTRRLAQAKNQQPDKTSRPEGDPESPSAYKGRPNPNTSRKKTRRKR